MTKDPKQPGFRSSIDSPISEPWWNRFLADYRPEPKVMLDIGTGLGRYARWFADKGFEATGIEKDERRLERAALLPNGDQVTFLHRDIADLADLGFDERSFGLIMDRNSSQFLNTKDQAAHFDAITNLLASTGVFYYAMVEPSGPHPPKFASDIDVSIEQARELIEERFTTIKKFERPSTNLPDMRAFEVIARSKPR